MASSSVWIQASVVEAIRNPKSSSRLSSRSSSVLSEVGDPVEARKEWAWKRATLVSSSAKEVVIHDELGNVTLRSGALEDGTILVDNEYPENKVPHDLITLTHLHEPAVVHCLSLRYQEDIIYTATGPVLLALNPFKTCRGLYSESTMKRYWERSEKNLQTELPPHVYAIADASFRSMMRLIDESLGAADSTHYKCDQSILVSGESGAGKTVTTKFVMKYLAALSQRSSLEKQPQRAYLKAQQQRLHPSPPGGYSWAVNNPSPEPISPTSFLPNSIESQVLQSNPILESFGNARTLRNDNSSRFGKFIQIQFTASGKLVGATIETYLLEKVRLVTQSLGERNYHVFYEVMAGMPSSELRNYCLAATATPQDFKMTCSGTYDRRDGVCDKDTYKALRTAMNTMKFPIEEQHQVFGVAVALLHASNLTFGETDHEQAVLEADNVHLEPVCLLLGVTPEDLNDALCSFSIQAGRDGSVTRKMTRPQAEKGLEALIKATYGALFLYLVGKINDSIAWKGPSLLSDEEDEEEEVLEKHPDEFHRPAASIGVLDIFGFETFGVNSFEQLCINYCNEALQQQFNAFVLKNEQEEYEREGIDWSFIEFPENQDVLDLIDKRGSGILNILDDQCRAPGTTDRSFASDVYSKCSSLTRFTANRKQVAAFQFEIQHYAGPVEYTTEGFVEKNRDELPKEATELLRGSINPFAQHLAHIIIDPESITSRFDSSTPPPPSESSTPMTPYKLSRTDSSVAARMTVGGQFRRQLRHLRGKIDQTCPHYIRCLKPNDNLIPDHFDAMVVAEQLRCGGILEAVRVSRAGFTQHYPHADFVRRYRSLGAKELGSSTPSVVSSSTPNGARNSWHGGGTSNGTSSSKDANDWKGSKSWNGGTSNGPVLTPVRSAGYLNSRGFAGTPSPIASQEVEESAKSKCNKLLKVIYRKMQQFEKEDKKENIDEEGNTSEDSPAVANGSSAPVKAKTYNVPSTPPPVWTKAAKSFVPTTPDSTATNESPLPPTPKTVPAKTKYPSWIKNKPEETATSPLPPPTPTYRSNGSFRRGMVSGGDLAKVGIQMGKTKVFLRHKAFETLERIRSREHTAAATKLNAIFRRYLARVAYIPIRDAYREEVKDHFAFISKERKEERPETPSTARTYSSSSSEYAAALIEKWESTVIRSIHNPVSRSECGREGSIKAFKWMLVEGIWVKNPQAAENQANLTL